MRIRIPTTIITKSIATIITLTAINSSYADHIDDVVNAEMKRQHIPGLSLAIVKNGKIVKEKGYGLANIEHHVAVKPETIFQSGSVGKQFTAALVMLLVQDGKIALDDSIEKYLPGTPPSWKKITIRHLLTHTSGLADPYDKLDMRKDYTDEEFIQMEATIPLLFEAGEQWSYSNMGYHLLGFLCNKVGGKFYGDQLRERIFIPAKMKSSMISERDLVPNRAAGYDLIKGKFKNQEWVSPRVNSTADGSLYLTARDLANWDIALTTDKPLSAAIKEASWTPVKLNNGNTYPYGFGWNLDTVNGHKTIQHDGAWQGFTTQISRYVDDKLTVIVLTNRSEARLGTIVQKIAGTYVPELAPRPAKPVPDTEPAVTQQVRDVLLKLADASIVPEEFTEKARAILFPKLVKELAEQISDLGSLSALQLLQRSVDGEDRQYRYRAVFGNESLLLEITFNKGGKIDKLSIEQE